LNEQLIPEYNLVARTVLPMNRNFITEDT